MYILAKHTNYITDRRLLNPIIDSPNMNTLNYAFVLVKKSDSEHLALKIAKVGT